MKAVRVAKFGGPDVLNVETVPIPKCSGSQVLVHVKAAGVNPVETYIRSGTHTVKPELPYTPGNDSAGVVSEVGPEVTKFKKGDSVFTTRKTVSGSYAEYCLAEETSCFPLPDRLTFSQGAAVGIPYCTAYRALFTRGNVKPSSTVLIHGASGAVGLAAVQLCKANGVRAFATAGSEDGLQVVKKCGAELVFNHNQENFTERLMAETGNEGVDVIVEMLANVNLAKDLQMVKKHGTVCVVGCRGLIEINPRILMGKESSVVGVMLGLTTQAEWNEMGAALGAGLEQGWLTPIVAKEYPLAEVGQAHRDIIESSGAKGKLVIKM